MNIFIREMRANRKALIIWCVSMFLGILSGMAKYTAYSAGGASADIFSQIPSTLRALLGMGPYDVTQMSGFFAMLFLYVELAAGIHAVLLGSGIIAKEERDKTTEFLMTKPVRRSAVLTAKLLAALVNILVLNAVSLVSSLALVSAYNKGADISGEVAVFLLSMLLVQMVFLTLGAALASCIRNAKVSGSLSAGILLFSFVISKVTDLTTHADALNILSPFKYFSYRDIVDGKGLSGLIVVLTLALCAALTGVVYRFYQRRDLNV